MRGTLQIILLTFLVWCSTVSALAAAQVSAEGASLLELKTALSPQNPLPYANIWIDESADWEIQDFLAISSSQPADLQNLVSGNMGVGSSAYWMIIDIVAVDGDRWFVESQFPGMDEVSIFSQSDDGEWSERKGGRNIGKSEEDYSQLGVAFAIDLEPGQSTKIILRFRNMGTSLLQLAIYDQDTFLKSNSKRLHYKYTFLGFMFAMLAYNFILYLATRNKGLQWYLIFQLIMIAFQSSGNAIHLHYLPSWAIPQSGVDYNFLALFVLSVPAMFFEQFIGRARISRSILLGTRTIAAINLLGFPILFLSSIGVLPPLSMTYFLLPSTVLSGTFYLLLFGIHAYQSRSVDSYIFVAAWLLSFFSLFAQALVFGGASHPSDLMTSLDEILVLGESIILATGISIRINSKLAASAEASERLVGSQLNEIAALQQTDLRSQSLMRELQHELRTPISALVGLTSEIRDRSSASQTEWDRYVATIEDSGLRLKELIEDTLNIVTSKRRESELTLEKVDLNELIDQCEILGRLIAKERSTFISTDVGLVKPINADRSRIIQVIVNLVNNVVEHAEAEHLCIAAFQTADDTYISIKDDGKGIPEEDLDRVFRPFYTTNSGEGNSGQGLSIVRKIVEWHGGQINVDSRVGEGSTFTIRIPFAITPKETGEQWLSKSANTLVESLDVGEQFSVMVVDDTEANLLVAKRYLRNSFNLVLIQQPDVVEDAIDRYKPDIILLDLIMPGRSGFEILSDLKFNPKYASLPIIVVSALTDSESIERALEMGAVDYIAKPLNPLELDRRINAHLSRQQLELVQEEYQKVLADLQIEEQSSPTTIDEGDVQQRAMLANLISTCYEAFSSIEPRSVAELAELSGLWTASMDGSRMRARTLEKYMNIDTIPARPNWKKVSGTANFVITMLDLSEVYRQQISQQLEELIEHRRQHRQIKKARKTVRKDSK